MDFTFSEEQQMLLDTARRFVAKDYGFEARRQIKEKAPEGFSREVWQGLADLGLLALNVPEAEGGLGGSAVETMLAMNAIGEGLLLEPYLASAVLATRTIASLGNDAQRAALLPALAAGEKIAALAHDEASSRYERMAIETRAWPVGSGYVITGHKSVVAHGSSADVLLVTARLAKAGESGPLAVFVVPRDAAGLRQVAYKTVDGVPACELWLNQVFVPAAALLGKGNDGGDVQAQVEQVLDFGLAAVCAEAVGALDKLLAATVEYARNRKQFGQPIGKFQALQHRMADMVLHIEQARSMSYLAAVRCADDDAELRGRSLSAAKVVIGQACRFVGQQAVQLHGGMGVTDELDVSHYFKRLMAIELQFGSTDHHLEMYAAQLA
ncbi:acyl-CoA dehydrogenase family protein [Noviherbaspirillum sp. UKPF54]|uniref:acyl-CoA dehydrogenase family protein n=1 Tax=Noviherbaspirillum sp. UKPF54 TaxID=2601898 RepID=UPI0011B1A644|nr:acyl-CoA dehydrogenase family protein [Noviherbaspirillum sp. UKPF54]QDZ26688.1 acyl-CoA dehydrogenase [Noviherbaspirillum sp. UKPF54]